MHLNLVGSTQLWGMNTLWEVCYCDLYALWWKVHVRAQTALGRSRNGRQTDASRSSDGPVVSNTICDSKCNIFKGHSLST